MRLRLIAIGSTAILAACVPRGGSDYRITTDTSPPAAKSPQIRAEQRLVIETPSWSPANVERNARRVETSTYIVQSGDTLLSIASRTGAGATAIASANNLKPPYKIRPGIGLQIPGGNYHRVGAGETGIAIARAYRTVWADIVLLNALQPPYTLQLGQNLRLPSSVLIESPLRQPTPEMQAAAFNLNIDDIVTGGNPAGTVPAIGAADANFAGRFAWPLRGNVIGKFGPQGGGRVNDGVNIAGEKDVAVRAAAPGVIVYSGNEIGVFGGLVLIDHGAGWITAYGHLGRLDVKKGDDVKVGQQIGGVGETGYVRQPQLHFQVRRNQQAVNPLNYLESING
jgi:murein DD-endopeptidase MepM/ murein hydrolase activator NlpD